MKRFKTAEYKGVQDSLVEINLFGVRVEPVQQKEKHDLLLLSDRGQLEFIKSIADRYKDSTINEYIDVLKGEYFDGDDPSIIDYSSKDLKMVFTISKNLNYEKLGSKECVFSPADRIEHLKLTLKLDPESGIKFTRWNRYATQYDTLNIAKMAFSKRDEFGGSLGGAFSGLSGQISGSSGQMMEEEQNVKQRYILLNGCITDSLITIEEEGVRDIDLAGNVIADVSMKFPQELFRVAKVSGLKKKSSDEFNDPESIKMNFDIVFIPHFKDSLLNTIKANLMIDYIYRHVISGYDTYYEWDDNVAYFRGHEKKSIDLFNKEEYLPQFYYIGLDGGSENSKNSSIIVKDVSASQHYMLTFRHYWEARDFFKWMLNIPGYNDNATIYISKQKYLLMENIANSKIVLTRALIRESKFTICKLPELTRLMPID